MLYTIIRWLLLTVGCAFGARYYIHMLQLESYQVDGFIRWLKSRGTRHALYDLAYGLAFIAADLLILAFTKAQSEGVQGGARITLAVLFLAATYTIMRKRAAISQKKALVFTQRAKRLYGSIVLVCAVAGLLLTLVNAGYALYALLPFAIMGGALLVQPWEKHINNGFFRDAQNKLAARTDIIKIGITGSYGKTSTKFFLKTLLDEKYNVLATPASFNTPMGLTRVIREQLKPEHQIFLAEMGARHVGDIKELCELVHPTVGIITSIGPQHLETFHSIENVAHTKNELMEALPEDGLAFFAADGGWVDKMYPLAKCEKHRAGLEGEKLFMRAENIQVSMNGSSFRLVCEDGGTCECTTQLLGKHNIQNIVLAAGVARRLGLTMEQIASGVSKLQPVEHRLQLMPPVAGRVIIDDSFNSNPAGAAAALEVLSTFTGTRCIVTPGMVELGEREAELNREFGRKMAGVCEAAVLLGKTHSAPIREGLIEAGFNQDYIFTVNDLESAKPILAALNADVTLFENDLPDNYSE